MTRPIPRLDPRCPDFLAWLCEEADRQQAQESASALMVAYENARAVGDDAEAARIQKRIEALRSGLASSRGEQRTQGRGSSRR